MYAIHLTCGAISLSSSSHFVARVGAQKNTDRPTYRQAHLWDDRIRQAQAPGGAAGGLAILGNVAVVAVEIANGLRRLGLLSESLDVFGPVGKPA